MKERIETLKAHVSARILELAQSPISVSYYDVDPDSLKNIVDDARIAAMEEINNAFVEELNA